MDVLLNSLFNAMYDQLRSSSSMLAFVEARVSAESFMRNECAFAAFDYLGAENYHVHMEKKDNGKIVDLLIYETEKSTRKSKPLYLFELKMAWPGGLGENVIGVRKDLDSMKGRENAWALVLFFAFAETYPGFPYQPTNIKFEAGLREFVKRLDVGAPSWRSNEFDMSCGKSLGKACLLAWPAVTPV